MGIKDTVARLMGRSVVDLAGEVDAALGRLAQARGLEAQATEALLLAQHDVARAQEEVAAARDALFDEHPDLRPQGVVVAPRQNGKTSMAHPHPTPGPAWESEPVEVDDADDPRFTAGASVVPVSDTEPLPPIVWGEHEDG